MFEAFETKRLKTRVDLDYSENRQILLHFKPFDAGRDASHISRNSIIGARMGQQ